MKNPPKNRHGLSLAARLTLGFAVVILLLLGTGALASWQISGSLKREQLQAAAELLRNSNLSNVRKTLDDRDIVAKNVSLILSDQELIQVEENRLQIFSESLDKIIQSLKESAGDEMKMALHPFEELEAKQRTTIAQVVKLVRAGETGAASLQLRKDSVPLAQTQRSALDTVIKAARADTQIISERTEKQGKSTILAIALMCGAASALGVVAAIWAAKSALKLIGGEPIDVASSAQIIARGDLSAFDGNRRYEVGSIAQAMQHMQEALQGLVATIRSSSDEIAHGIQEIAGGSNDLSLRSERQAAQLQQASGAACQLAESVQENVALAREAVESAGQAQCSAEEGEQQVMEMGRVMDRIAEASKRINDITGVIDGIAFQTNILSLNASVEAARAGTHGRGFGVVADEIRSLSQRSAIAAQEIRQLISRSREAVDEGHSAAGRSKEGMRLLVKRVSAVQSQIQQISSASIAQDKELSGIVATVVELDDITQQNAALAEESAAAASALSDQAEKLVGAARSFTLPGDAIRTQDQSSSAPKSQGAPLAWTMSVA